MRFEYIPEAENGISSVFSIEIASRSVAKPARKRPTEVSHRNTTYHESIFFVDLVQLADI